MNTTLFFAQIWGPVLLAVGIGMFVSKAFYTHVYRDLQKEALAVLAFGMASIAAGIIQIRFHNLWGTLTEVVISLLGWGLLLKGLAMAIAPKLVDRGGDWTADSKLVPAIGVLLLIVGAYLSWAGYIA